MEVLAWIGTSPTIENKGCSVAPNEEGKLGALYVNLIPPIPSNMEPLDTTVLMRLIKQKKNPENHILSFNYEVIYTKNT